MPILEILVALTLIAVVVDIAFTVRNSTSNLSARQSEQISQAKSELLQDIRATRIELNHSISASMRDFSTTLKQSIRETTEMQDKRIHEITHLLTDAQSQLQVSVSARLKAIDDQFRHFTEQNNVAMEGIRKTVQDRLDLLQQDNHQQLEKMRDTVDEKLQKTLDERITQSFKMVSDRLQDVYTGLGEMKNLASGVGDLKKVLSNVKTRGILGEYQLNAIVQELLSKEQYEENIVTKRGSTNRVEFAIKLPGEGDHPVYLPIDAKFPGDAYAQLVEAYDAGEPGAIAEAQTTLEARVKASAKDIHDKYIDPPYTTDFGILFLPFEGLYAEVVRRGLVEVLQRQYKINVAGPTTFAALLNSLQMGFRTLAIQKRSGEVWSILGAVKTEFNSFASVLASAQKRIEQTGEELEKLVGARTKKITNKLRSVEALPAIDSSLLLDTAPEANPTDG